MKGFYFKKRVMLAFCTLLGISVSACCFRQYHRLVAPFPAKVPSSAKITMNFNACGNYFVADRDGKPVRAEAISFTALLNRADKMKPGWMEVLGSYTLFEIEKGRKVWLCDKDFQCIEGLPEGQVKSAVFGLNYDGSKLFFSNAQGHELSAKELKPFASLVRETSISSDYGLKTLNSLVVYKIKGSELIVSWDPYSNMCYVTCYDRTNGHTCGLVGGGCPANCP